MESEKLLLKELLKSIQIIHLALLAGLMGFGVVAVYINSYNGMDAGVELNEIFVYVVSIFAIIGVLASKLLFKKKLKICISKPNIKEKLDEYRGALIIKFALIEGSAFFAIIAYMITGDIFFIAIFILLLIVFITDRPTKEKLIIELELNADERKLI